MGLFFIYFVLVLFFHRQLDRDSQVRPETQRLDFPVENDIHIIRLKTGVPKLAAVRYFLPVVIKNLEKD